MNYLMAFVLVLCVQVLTAGELPVGHPTVKEVLDAKGEKTDQKSAPLPNTGIVVSTIHSNNYTYIELKNEQESIWLAAPRVDLIKDTRIRYGRGIAMVNFYSNRLKREFPEIYFVERVEVTE